MQTPSDSVLDHSADFREFGDWTYLNCAYHGPMPVVAEEALAAAVEMRRNPARLLDEYHFTFPTAYRKVIAALIGAPPEDIALADSTTHGLMLLVGGLDWRAGDEVVVPAGEYRQHVIAKGRNRDTAWFAIIDSEWPEIRRRMTRWLETSPEDRGPLNPGGGLHARLRDLLSLEPRDRFRPPD